jgi:biopolymer transport protein ExbB
VVKSKFWFFQETATACHGLALLPCRRYKQRSMPEFMQKGGPMMWLILACSVLAGAIFLERVAYFHRATIRVGEFLRGLARLIESGRYADALHECASVRAPVARVVHAAILRHEAPRAELRDVVQEAGQLEVPRLERRLAMLAAIVFTAPLLGLLGTVMGLIEAFTNLSAQAGFTSLTDLSSGIYQALISTAAGLVVATPGAVACAFLNSRVNTLLHDMERAGIEIVNLLCDRRGKTPEIIDFVPPGQAEVRRQMED